MSISNGYLKTYKKQSIKLIFLRGIPRNNFRAVSALLRIFPNYAFMIVEFYFGMMRSYFFLGVNFSLELGLVFCVIMMVKAIDDWQLHCMKAQFSLIIGFYAVVQEGLVECFFMLCIFDVLTYKFVDGFIGCF